MAIDNWVSPSELPHLVAPTPLTWGAGHPGGAANQPITATGINSLGFLINLSSLALIPSWFPGCIFFSHLLSRLVVVEPLMPSLPDRCHRRPAQDGIASDTQPATCCPPQSLYVVWQCEFLWQCQFSDHSHMNFTKHLTTGSRSQDEIASTLVRTI